MAVTKIGVLTSGGDASGMNAAVRAIVRTALDNGLDVCAIHEGYRGLIEGGDMIRPLGWRDAGGIIHRGGTVIGSARSQEFRTREGRLKAARHMLQHGIDSLVVVGGDGSLTGADVFRREWPGLLEELVGGGDVSADVAARHPRLTVVGLVGSIDNDAAGTDMTIGADTALHRITEAIDAIGSTASSHQRAFIVEVMGRHCGYLALMGAIATGADALFIPECPPGNNWETGLVDTLKAGRAAGRRDSIVVVAEGAMDRQGIAITAERLQDVLSAWLPGEVRITVLGHMQRGGAPSAFDRNLGTVMGYAAIETLLSGEADTQSLVMGMRGNRVVRIPLEACVSDSRRVNEALEAREFDHALELRGASFNDALRTFNTLQRALPHPPREGRRRLRLGILHAGAAAPGMNAAVRTAVRLATDDGHVALGIRRGFPGLAAGELSEMDWMSVNGWAPMGGAELGTSREVPAGPDLYAIARTIELHAIDGILVIGGWEAYDGAHRLFDERKNFPAFNIPIICLPATIDNNLPGTELSIGADTALNNIVSVVDKIKQAAVAEQRCYVVEVMGRRCGYLATMSGLATGAERVYLHEDGITLKGLVADLELLVQGFRSGKRLGLMIRSEGANDVYNTAFICALFEEEGGGLFDVRQSILGHLQQGGDPSPFDRIQATRLARLSIRRLAEQAAARDVAAEFIGMRSGNIEFGALEDYPRLIDAANRRPKQQWWLEVRKINETLSRPAPRVVPASTET